MNEQGTAEDERINVLFMQTQEHFGPDAQVHRLVMEHTDPDRVGIHVACNDSNGSAALAALRRVPDIAVRPTNFGPTISARSPAEVLRGLAHLPAFLSDMIGLARYARRHRIQVVHGTEKPRDVIYARFIAKTCGAKTITHLHIKVEDWIRPSVRRLLHSDDALIAVSSFVADSAIAMGYSPDRIHTVHNALDASRWDPDGTDPTEVRREFGVADDAALLLIVARINPWKGHELLLRALARLRDDGVRFHLLVVGDDDPGGTPAGGGQLNRVRDLIAELVLAEHVTVTGFRSDVRELMAASDAFTMPTFEEPFGLVFLEVMAMRKPIAALRSGAAVEVIEEGVTGLLSEPGDVDGLAANIRALIEDPDGRDRMGHAGRARVLDRFTPDRLVCGVESVWRSVVASQ